MEGVSSESRVDSKRVIYSRAKPVEQLESVREENLSKLGRSRPSRNQSLLETHPISEGLVNSSSKLFVLRTNPDA